MSGFTFKQFHIEHDKCAMKVGTDGILLGAWANLPGAENSLDIGTGTGLIALMLKQRNPAMAVTAVEIDDDAFAQAKANIVHSPWPNIELCQGDIANFNVTTQFDLIVSNPPYVDEEDMNCLPDEFTHEPVLGLAAGTDGLKLVRRILANAPDYLTEKGILICEVGNSMVHMTDQYSHIPFTWIEFENGGHGVFMLTRAQLLEHATEFSIYKD